MSKLSNAYIYHHIETDYWQPDGPYHVDIDWPADMERPLYWGGGDVRRLIERYGRRPLYLPDQPRLRFFFTTPEEAVLFRLKYA